MHLRLALLASLVALPAVGQSTTAQVRQEAESYLRPCITQGEQEQRWCERLRQEFVNDYLRARAGEYQGQRNVAFSLSGAARDVPVTPNAIQSCAWRLVIMSAGHSEVGDGDNANLRTDCARAGDAGLTAARIRAQQLLVLIGTDPVRNPPSRSAPSPRHRSPLDGTASPLTADPPRPR